MVPQRPFFILMIATCFFTYTEASAQDYYFTGHRNLYSIDANTCKIEKVFTMDEDYGLFLDELAFHPNGRLYATTPEGLLEIDPKTWTLLNFVPWSHLGPPSYLNSIFFDENGIGLISRDVTFNGGTKDESHFYYYDARDQKVLRQRIIPDAVYQFGLEVNGKIGEYYMNRGIYKTDSILFDLENLKYVDIPTWPTFVDYSLYDFSIEWNPCKAEPSLMGIDIFNGKKGVVKANIQSGEIFSTCQGIENIFGKGGGATPTDFRRSPLRIDLDANNSSGHRAAGYYDTLTTCRNEVPLMDDDVELYICGAEVDYISFRLKYYDDPRLPEERIYSDGFTNPVLISPGRYVWQNPYGADEGMIKEYLRSLRYRASWSDPDERDRVVMTTMHVGEDSTTSWSVYQLETDEVFAGQDTTITYCPDGTSIELTDYLSAGVSKDGRIDPELASGTTVFTPGQDGDGDYLYILEKMDCADTAVLTVESLETGLENIGLDTVSVCKGQQAWIGFPSGKYDSIEWWDGSTGDSVWISADGRDHFVLVNQSGCGIRIPIMVVEQDVEGIAGRDTTIRYCEGGAEIDLTKILGLPDEYSCEIIPALSNGSLVFDPAVDMAGTYQLVACIKGCTDTATIEMEETTTQELVLEPIRLCTNTTHRIGLEPGVYDQVTWWNGDSGDSTTVIGTDTGPFTVEARLGGCTYEGEVDMTIVPEVVLPADYPDHIMVCEGNPPKRITVTGLDSVLRENSIYYPGEEIMISAASEYILRGYQGGCFAEKTIMVDVIKDPSDEFSYIAEWCGRQSLTIKLPEDNATWRFRWEDGTDSSSRTIDSIGRHPFLIESDSCTFTGFYDVIESTDCDEECTVSIPNALTPNGDGINDNLEVFSDCSIQVTHIRIFDKWGGKLYHVQGDIVEAQIWADIPPGVVMVQVTYETGQGVMKTAAGGVLVVK